MSARIGSEASRPTVVRRTAPNGSSDTGSVMRPSIDAQARPRRAGTGEGAYSWRMERELGSISVGKAANFTVLGQDPFTIDPMGLRDVPVLGTVYEGRWFPANGA